jgi:hypothetical protein
MESAHDLGSDIWARIYNKKKDIVSRKIVGETFLVPLKNNVADMQHIFSLNPVAEHIWEQLDGKKDLNEIRGSVLQIFEVEKTEAESDIQDFIDEMLKAGLIEGAA